MPSGSNNSVKSDHNSPLHKNCIAFTYTDNDFVIKTTTWNTFQNNKQLTKFDRFLRSCWDAAMSKGYFRYTLDEVRSRRVDGKHGYILQLNLKRGTERRKPQRIDTLTLPFDRDSFNFTKVKSEEFICHLYKTELATSDSMPSSETVEQLIERNADMVLINVSPAEYGHVLLVPEISSGIPQKMTLKCVQLGIEMLLLSRHPGFRVGFNSLCALASINHQHIHAWYLEDSLIVEYTPVVALCPGLYETTDLPCKAFVFELHGTTVQKLTQSVFSTVNYLQETDIAHNVIITRAVQVGQPQCSAETTLRVYVWPRKSITGVKKVMGEPTVAFNVATFELAGHIPMFDADVFESLTEEAIETKIRTAALDEGQYAAIRSDIINILSSQ